MRCVFFLILLLTSLSTLAQEMVFTDETTDVTFTTKRHIGTLDGLVRGVSGTASLDTNNLSAAYINISFATSTLLHNDRYTGPDFTSSDCFDVKKYPAMTLKSTSIAKLKGINKYQLTGGLIVKNHTGKVSFPFTAVPNIGGYDFVFDLPLIKKEFKMKCGFRKKIIFHVRGYGKRKLA